MFTKNFSLRKLQRTSAAFADDQSGAVLALVAVVLIPVLIGGAALAIDLGFAFSRQRQMQVAADAAAYSGAASLVQNAQGKTLISTYYAQEAQGSAAAAGFPNSGNITVTPSLNTVNLPNDTVTVKISEKRNWMLAQILGVLNPYTNAVQAVAHVSKSNYDYCMVALGCSSKGYGILIQGNTSVTSPNGGCGMMSNCTNTAAPKCSITQSGSANTVNMPVYTAGGDCVSGQSTFNVTQDAYKSSDPFVVDGFNSWLQGISWPASSPDWTSGYGPGFYNNMQINTSSGTVTLAPGIYYIAGSLQLNGGTLTGSNVTLIFGPNASVTELGNAQFTTNAPTTGPTAGVALAGLTGINKPNTVISLLGNSGFGGTGAIYFPNAEVDFQGNNASGGQCVQIVANAIAFQGSSSIVDTCPNAGATAVNFKIRLIN